jgi:hypothetical protein
MFISKEEVEAKTGVEVDAQLLALAQTMIEAYIGKDEVQVESAEDMAILANATAFQAVYIKENPAAVMGQAALKTITDNTSTTTFLYEEMSPFMSPWAVRVCKRLSWTGSRSIHTGPMHDRVRPLGWEYE